MFESLGLERSIAMEVIRLETVGRVERVESIPSIMTEEPPSMQTQRSFMPVHASGTGTSKSKESMTDSEKA